MTQQVLFIVLDHQGVDNHHLSIYQTISIEALLQMVNMVDEVLCDSQ